MSLFGPRKPKAPEPVKVAYAANQAEAEMIEGILNEQGIPCMIQRARGFDVADFLAAGPRNILVPGSAEEKARKILADLESGSDSDGPEGPDLGSGDSGEDDSGEAPDFPSSRDLPS